MRLLMLLPMHLHLDRSLGLGRQRRLLAISQEWTKLGGRAERYMNRAPTGPAIHVFDGYTFNGQDLSTAKKTGGVVVLISDDPNTPYAADIVVLPLLLDRNWFAPIDPEIRYLAGPKYFPLRDSFKQIPAREDDGKPVKIDEEFDCDMANRVMHPNTFTYHMAQAK